MISMGRTLPPSTFRVRRERVFSLATDDEYAPRQMQCAQRGELALAGLRLAVTRLERDRGLSVSVGLDADDLPLVVAPLQGVTHPRRCLKKSEIGLPLREAHRKQLRSHCLSTFRSPRRGGLG